MKQNTSTLPEGRGGTWYRHGGTNLMVPSGLSREVLAVKQILKNQIGIPVTQARLHMPMQRQRLQNEQPLMRI